LLEAFDDRMLAKQPDVDRIASILLDDGEADLARRYLTETAHVAAADALQLLDRLADALELRTRLLHGIRTPESPFSGPPGPVSPNPAAKPSRTD
jgi:hypothetical protein